MKYTPAILLTFLLGILGLCVGCQQQETVAASPEREQSADSLNAPVVAHQVSRYSFTDAQVDSRILADLNFLASDEQEGRGPYSKGLQASAEYIAEQFADAGLNTKLIEGKPFQVFATRERVDLGENNHLAFQSADGKSRKITGDDYRPLSPSVSGAFDLPLAFAGYGISSPRDAYDDYAQFDGTGKAVIVLRHEPDQAGRTQKFAGSGNSKFAYLSTKVINAIEHGAGAVILVTDEAAIKKEKSQGDKLLSFQIRMPKDFQPKIPVLHMKRSAVDALLKEAGKPSLSEWEASVDESLLPNSFDLTGARVTGEVEIETSERTQQNVLGVLPGKGRLASEIVVVGAHYDHLGYGGSGSLAPWTREIHNGADDNASGTVALLETARQCAVWDGADRRTILFIAFGAEEQGLIGSEYYVRHPLFATENTVAMLNYDMVGRLRKDRLTVYGHNTAEEFEAWMDEAAAKHDVTLNKIPGGYGPSDHASFYGRGIPVMHDFTGFHSQYHRPSDDVEHINVPGIRKVVGMNIDILQHLVKDKIVPIKNAEGSLLDLYFGGIGSGGPPSKEENQEGGKRALGVQVGDPQPNGIPIIKVTPGSAAEKAGLRGGDILTGWGETKITSIDQLRTAVRATQLDQKISVRIMRAMLELELEVEFPK
ncbi:Aminopeptidase YwaD precursor [Bremerella volcania]|uniref:Aminopeptidase YwaD n=1 Tax=Bremerella volcania TaxID=2527984 RepID=A0A518CBE4_9BACT|nr:M28 family peptidase [Bremerella volcania]QDU76549.1 Aminopeptidase YwaD precursor [Bremerella volcania]